MSDIAGSSYYEVLGVSRDASDDDIRRAWARCVRSHPPDKDPTGNQRVNEAKRTLLDPKARCRYDSMLDHGPEIQQLLDQASTAAQSEDHQAAARALKRVLALNPDDDTSRNLYALELKRAGETRLAVQVLRGLVERAPDVGLYRYNLGTMLLELDGDDRETRTGEALHQLTKAVGLEPTNADYYIGLAHCHVQLGRFAEAEQALETAIMTDGVVNLQDLDALFELALIHLVAGQPERINKVADRVLEAVDGIGDDAVEYCGYRFAQIAADLAQSRLLGPALHFAEAAVKCSPASEELVRFLSGLRRLHRIEVECERLVNDMMLPDALKRLLLVRALFELDQMNAQEAQGYAREAARGLVHLSSPTLLRALNYAEATYPAIYALSEDVWQHIRSSTASSRGPTPQGSGCIVTIFVLGLAVAFLVLVL